MILFHVKICVAALAAEWRINMIRLNKGERILFFGDSITHGGRLQSMDGNHIIGHGYQSIIASKLGYENIENMPKFINKGVSGDSISQMYSRLYSDVIVNKPDIISILAGINDVGKGMGVLFWGHHALDILARDLHRRLG